MWPLLSAGILAEIGVVRIWTATMWRPLTRGSALVLQGAEALSLRGLARLFSCSLARWEELATVTHLWILEPLVLSRFLELALEGVGVRHGPILNVDLDRADVVHRSTESLTCFGRSIVMVSYFLRSLLLGIPRTLWTQ